MENDYKCPKCGSDHTTRVPIKLMSGVKGTWYLLILCSLFGVVLSPLCIIICVGCIVIGIIYNLMRKITHKNEWVMQCQRCGNEYTVVNIDKVDAIRRKEVQTKEKQEKTAEHRKEAAAFKAECLSRNGMLEPDEDLLAEVSYFGFHKNTFSNSNGKLKVIDRGYICYNDKGSFHISKETVIDVKKKNYFGMIPTGIQIRTRDKRKKYNFVVYVKDRDEILSTMQLTLVGKQRI